MVLNRRVADRGGTALLIVGILLVSAGVAFKALAVASDVLVIALVLIGGTLMPGSRIVDLVRAWRKGNGGAPQDSQTEERRGSVPDSK